MTKCGHPYKGFTEMTKIKNFIKKHKQEGPFSRRNFKCEKSAKKQAQNPKNPKNHEQNKEKFEKIDFRKKN